MKSDPNQQYLWSGVREMDGILSVILYYKKFYFFHIVAIKENAKVACFFLY